MKVTKQQVQFYFEETFHGHWDVIAEFLNSKTETKEIMIKDILEQTKGRYLYREMECHKCNDSVIDYECIGNSIICRNCFKKRERRNDIIN